MHWSRDAVTAAVVPSVGELEGFHKGCPVKGEIPVEESRKMEGPQAQRIPPASPIGETKVEGRS